MPCEAYQRSADCVSATLADHEPQSRRLERVVSFTLDRDDAIRPLETLAERASGRDNDQRRSDPPEPPEGSDHQVHAEHDDEGAKCKAQVRTGDTVRDHRAEPTSSE